MPLFDTSSSSLYRVDLSNSISAQHLYPWVNCTNSLDHNDNHDILFDNPYHSSNLRSLILVIDPRLYSETGAQQTGFEGKEVRHT